MSEQTTNPGDSRDLRELLAVVLDAFTLPYGVEDYDKRMADRTGWARTAVEGALTEDPADIGWNADYLRGKLRAEEAEAAAREKNRCQRCRKPFDQDDTAPDGRARHGETAYCRGCVDNCHDGGTEHACVICDPKRYGGGR
ncbi:hypothetical protein [Streptomyces stelliscabiei]|uniref:hypothetical protein n=1 Tax=Streptomyces stelliscabiei TaxID=146820 RepID=UPI0029BDEB2A|nr:hypothetical protein [Streptomyces stelliscabiei]MDX2639932.1 hypothetical protein [Streptomyces stelliscabiei]MDX2662846.1 hypothetical protein [Streptomyces stelliscabiei]MDX2714512.1 hypothetical protein [Streptomyces stelliscabiei]MDX2792249.1 hypothetical protein [Streptomyces stelliscabiei]